jgi:hypothetical protein
MPLFPPKSVFLLAAALFHIFSTTNAFDRNSCLNKLGTVFNQSSVIWIRQELFDKSEPSVTAGGLVLKKSYFLDQGGINATSPVLTPSGCEALCNDEPRWYTDIGQRFMTWLLPVVLLVANVEVSPMDKWRYLELIHFIGDPIDSFWSLLSKAESWTHCHHLASTALVDELPFQTKLEVKELGTLLAVIEDVLGPETNPLDCLLDLLKQWSNMGLPESVVQSLKSAAFDIAESRTNDLLRTGFGVSLYLLQVVAAFVATLGGGIQGQESPPGGRIGTAMQLTWLIPAVLLSNTIGGFTTRRASLTILGKMVQQLSPVPDEGEHTKLIRTLQNPELYFRNQRWMGGTDIYRPQKAGGFYKAPWRQWVLVSLAAAPILVSSLSGSVIIWYSPPIGLNCRSIMLIIITIVWLLSAFCTWITWTTKLVRGRAHWNFVIARDLVVAAPIMLIVFLSSAGLFNTCRCWSAELFLKQRACIPMNWEEEYSIMNKRTYPAIAGVCVGLQLIFFILMLVFERRGFLLMRWSERKRQNMYMATFRSSSSEHNKLLGISNHSDGAEENVPESKNELVIAETAINAGPGESGRDSAEHLDGSGYCREELEVVIETFQGEEHSQALRQHPVD